MNMDNVNGKWTKNRRKISANDKEKWTKPNENKWNETKINEIRRKWMKIKEMKRKIESIAIDS